MYVWLQQTRAPGPYVSRIGMNTQSYVTGTARTWLATLVPGRRRRAAWSAARVTETTGQ
jgi:DNA-binding IclR family transcriptional regulator